MDIKNIFSILPVKSLPMMKAVFLLLSSILLSTGLSAQLLNVTPSFPKDTSAVSIIMDATKGNQGLLNYANPNDVYVHVGVITNLSTGPSDWKYVKFTWGSTDAAAKATSLGNNKYQYIINNARTFLGVPASETILRISILFRNGSGTTVQRNTDGGDMYVRIYDASLAGRYILPPLEPKYNAVPEPINKSIGDSLRVTWLTNNLADIKLFFNGTQVNAVTSSIILKDSLPILTSGNQRKDLVAETIFEDYYNHF